MIARIWRGWTTAVNADAFATLLTGTVVPGFEARAVAGFLHIDVLRRDDGDEVQFTTIMIFDSIKAVKRFAGDDAAVALVPDAAQALLARFDDRVVIHDVLGSRGEPEHARGRA